MDLHKTDPEFAERFEYFAFQEVPNEEGRQLPEKIRYMAILAVLIGCGGADAYREMLPKALDGGVTPVMIKEIVYQAVDYLGYGRMLPFLSCTNEIFSQKGIELPLPAQATTTLENRLEKGVEAQAEIFGEYMKEAWKTGHINRWLAENCFGDYYTRKGLTLSERELITFCFLAAQGGCVIIGRCADYVLDGTEGLIRVFLYADIKVREERVRERNLYADKDVLKNIHRIDRERRDYNRYYAGRDWEKPENYDLLINTTQIGVDGAVQLIKDYLKMRGLL